MFAAMDRGVGIRCGNWIVDQWTHRLTNLGSRSGRLDEIDEQETSVVVLVITLLCLLAGLSIGLGR